MRKYLSPIQGNITFTLVIPYYLFIIQKKLVSEILKLIKLSWKTGGASLLKKHFLFYPRNPGQRVIHIISAFAGFF